MIGLHESPYLPNNHHSLLSTGQARESGVWCDNVLKRHGGGQCLRASSDEDEVVTLDLDVDQGLLKLDLSYPTDDEFKNLPVVWLTSPGPWNPEVLDDDNTVQMSNLLQDQYGTLLVRLGQPKKITSQRSFNSEPSVLFIL